MILQSKIGLALLGIGLGGLWWLNRKKTDDQESAIIDTEFEEIPDSQLLDGSTFNKPVPMSVQVLPKSVMAVATDGTNSLNQPFTDVEKQNLVNSRTPKYVPKQGPDCSIINGFGSPQRLNQVPVFI
jgi:hypothetical protein